MPISGPILVFLANGVQGSAVIRTARQRGHAVRALVRRPPDDALPSADCVTGDLDDPTSLIAAARGCAHAVLQVPTAPAPVMLRQTAHALAALREVGLASIILRLASASRPAPCPEPSFVANAAVERLVRQSGLACAVVRPTLYLDNLLKPSARADIVERGIFAPPIARHQRIAWTSADDCARAAILLLEQRRFGGDHCVAGPESVTGDQLAARLSAGLGKPIAYRADPLDAFEREVDTVFGPAMGRAVAAKFRYFRDAPDDADRILAVANVPGWLAGFEPTAIEAWARQHRANFGL